MPTSASSRSSPADPLAVFRRITHRDRDLLALLAEHYLLSTDQVTEALFPSRRLAQRRLTLLYRLGVLHRFAVASAAHTAVPYLYTLGPTGLAMFPTVYNDPDSRGLRPPRSSMERARRIAASRKVGHLLGTNGFFVSLLALARREPGTVLRRWWSEQHASDVFALSGARPDGHGVIRRQGRTVGFFLEYDTGSENLSRVVAKLRAYERLAQFGPRYPVLFWVHSRRREVNLLGALAGLRSMVAVATAVQGRDPGGRVWTVAAEPDRLWRLDELPSEHGPQVATNPNRFDDLDAEDVWPS